MRTYLLVSALIGLLIVLSGCASPTGQIVSGYDEYKGEEYLVLHSMHVGSFVYMSVGKTSHLPRPRLTMFSTSTHKEGWRFLRCHSLYLLADGERISTTDPIHQGEIGRSVLNEWVRVLVKDEELEKMAYAKNVKGRLCNYEFTLSPEQIAQVRVLYEEYQASPRLTFSPK